MTSNNEINQDNKPSTWEAIKLARKIAKENKKQVQEEEQKKYLERKTKKKAAKETLKNQIKEIHDQKKQLKIEAEV